jgi:hypothetical protein
VLARMSSDPSRCSDGTPYASLASAESVGLFAGKFDLAGWIGTAVGEGAWIWLGCAAGVFLAAIVVVRRA